MYKKKETLIGYAFVAPALISFFVLVAFPFFFSIFLAFTKWNFLSGFKGIQWVGLENFKNLLEDKLFYSGYKKYLFLCYYNSSSFYCDFTDSGIYLERKNLFKKIFKNVFFYSIYFKYCSAGCRIQISFP